MATAVRKVLCFIDGSQRRVFADAPLASRTPDGGKTSRGSRRECTLSDLPPSSRQINLPPRIALSIAIILCAFIASAKVVIAADDRASDAAMISTASYVGSQACKGCHERIFTAWQTTLHSFSTRTAEQAQTAGLPLPPTTADGDGTARHWTDIALVFGGRQRLTYIDQTGKVMQPGFDVRLQRWDTEFPDGHIDDCATCHVTSGAPGAVAHTRTGSKFSEPNIGCESCHGPGGTHIETFDRADIKVDTSSAACGTCHTGAGRALPAVDAHTTHDFVQTWHQDAHSRGLAKHTISAGCATCHSPADGQYAPFDNPARLVLAEHKNDISCVSCHDPHQMTNPVYRVDAQPVAPPQMSALNVLVGRDGDFTTTDFKILKTVAVPATVAQTILSSITAMRPASTATAFSTVVVVANHRSSQIPITQD